MEQWQLDGSGAEAYERYAVGQLFRPLGERLLAGVQLRPGARVLDVACGTGIVARLAAPRIGLSGEATGVDVNQAMLAVARARSAEEGTRIIWMHATATALPFADRRFDAVFCQQGLQFFADKAKALVEMRRVTVPGGVIALAVFGQVNRFDAALGEALGKYIGERSATMSLARFALGDAGALRSLLCDAGFEQAETRTVALTRRVEPSQAWLLQSTAGVPYGRDIAAMEPAARAAMMREIASKLKDLWIKDSFAVPMDVHLVYARSSPHSSPSGARTSS